jgi:hypothetical protein
MIKNFLAVGIIILGLFFFISGSILPWSMARGYINALRLAGQGQESLDIFLKTFKKSLDYPSPIGKEEVVKFLSGDLKEMIANQEESVAKALVDFIEPYLFKDEVRHLLTKAEIYHMLWRRFNKREDFIRAAEAYQEAGKIGINLPQPIYGLYNLFLEGGQKELANRVGKEILRLWPNETRIKLSQ